MKLKTYSKIKLMQKIEFKQFLYKTQVQSLLKEVKVEC